MIPISTFLACFVTLFVSLILPVLVLIVYGVKNRGKGIVSAWLLGAVGFFVPQILIRLPLLNLLSASAGFASFVQAHPFPYVLALAFTAGLFELAGRYAAARCMKRDLTFQRALAAGLGHGGIEAMLIVGMTYINNLIYLFMIQSGAFDALVAQTAAAGGDVSQLQAVRDSLVNVSAGLFLIGGLERLLTMVCHAAMSVLVCWGVHTGRVWTGLLICLGIHTLIDAMVGLQLLVGKGLSQRAAYGIIYGVLALVALGSLVILKKLRGCWEKGETL